MSAAVGYLRRSRVTSDRHLSWDVQEVEIRALAARHGDDDLELLSDWGKSGRGEKTALRASFRRLREMIDQGSVSVVYSYSLSRLARSLSEYASLAELCRDRGVRVRLVKEGEFAYDTASGRLIVDQLARFAQFEAELAQERAKDTIKARRARGDYLGRPPYGMMVKDGKLVEDPREPVEPVVEAYRATGNFHAAARELNRTAFPTRRATRWSDTTVRTVIRRVDGDGDRPRVSRSRLAFRLAGLLRCHCGNVMTGTADSTRGFGPYMNYACGRARIDPDHLKPKKVTERRILPLVQAEADRLRIPEAIELEADQQQHDTLLERRKRVLDNYEDGHIERAERDAKLEAIADEIERLDVGRRIVGVPAIDWNAAPAVVNGILRLVFERIELGPDLLPARYVWTVPEWRAE